MNFNNVFLFKVKYIEGETLTVNVHYRKWNYDGSSAEIQLTTQTQVKLSLIDTAKN